MIKKSLLVITFILVQVGQSSATQETYFYVSKGNCFCRTRFKVKESQEQATGKAKPKPKKLSKKTIQEEQLNHNHRKAAIAAIERIQEAAKYGKNLDALLSKQK